MSYKFEKLTVLVVEELEPMRDLVRDLLVTFGIGRVLNATTGQQAFETFRKEKPDLVISDWLSEPMTGLDLVYQIRRSDKSPDPYVPIILMTGFSEKRRVENARDMGTTEFLVKPFTAQALYQRIETIIEKPRQFVKTEEFFGPDRRRRKSDYKGPERRGER